MVEKIKDLRAKTDEQLEEEIVTLKKEGLNLRFQQASGQLTNTDRRRQVKRAVAKIKTLLTERKNAAQKSDKKA